MYILTKSLEYEPWPNCFEPILYYAPDNIVIADISQYHRYKHNIMYKYIMFATEFLSVLIITVQKDQSYLSDNLASYEPCASN